MKTDQYRALSDEEIITLIHDQGRVELFGILYDRYFMKVRDKCFGFIRDRRQAGEFAEDIFSKVYEKITGNLKVKHFSSWLYSVTYNHCIDYLRNKKKLHYPEWNRENRIPEIPDESEEDFSGVDYDILMKVLDMIHPEERALIMMKYQDNISLREIGKSLRISEDAAKMRLKRARTRIIYLYKMVTN